MALSRRQRRKKTRQTIGVIATSLFAIVSLVITGLFMGGTLTPEMFGFGGDDTGYKNITLTDAQYVCEQEAREEFGKRMSTLTIDSLSSRYEENSNRYKMYFSVDLYPKYGGNKDIPVNYLLNCFVHGSRGSVTHFESVENKEEGPKPIRKSEGNIFGL